VRRLHNSENLAGFRKAALAAAHWLDDAAAHACEIVRELMQSFTNPDRSLQVKVRDETRPMVLSIPFLAACA
jgi:hypothetical protein